MDSKIIEEIDKYYDIAIKIAGEDGDDLLHHVLMNFDNKRKLKGNDLTYYFTCILRNEYRNRRSSFHKLHSREELKEDIEYFESTNYDGDQLNDILKELSKDNSEAVDIFKRCYFESSVKQVAKELGVSKMTIYRNYITFIKNEIKKRYEHILFS
tara:strand:- start:650 stop:1114 length:465 start_codon:yes stop_codon:yes gene_type:complete